MAKAACALECASRWAVSGTPVQNRLGDLAALLKFLRVHPYDDAKRFDADISQMWKTGDSAEAVKRLKRLFSCILLRRPKTIIDLPPRRDVKVGVDFYAAEREFYNKLRDQAIIRMDEAFTHGTGPGTNAYISVIQRINALRMVCNLGIHYNSRHDLAGDVEHDASSQPNNWSDIAQRVFDIQREMYPDSIVCVVCQAPYDHGMAGSRDYGEQQTARFARCEKFICEDCVREATTRHRTVSCGHDPSHPVAPVSLNIMTIEDVPVIPDSVPNPLRSAPKQMSSKIATLISQLTALPVNVKWYVLAAGEILRAEETADRKLPAKRGLLKLENDA